MPDSTPTPFGTRLLSWCLKILGAVGVMVLGAGLGMLNHRLFSTQFSRIPAGTSGLMMVSFLVGIPLTIGALVAFLARRKRPSTVGGASGLAMLSVLLFMFLAGLFLREGIICIVMATPIFLVFALVGALIGVLLDAWGGRQAPKLLSVILVVPLFTAPIEAELTQATQNLRASQSIFINAPAQTVWQHINYPLNIEPTELRGGFAYLMGVPYPIEARTLEEKIGAARTLVWQRGVQFTERITAWEPHRHIAWTYQFTPDSFPPGSLDDHIAIGGRYFDLKSTAYSLHPQGNGTRLSIDVHTSISTHFNWYAAWWADFLIDDTAKAILNFYKTRSEQKVPACRRDTCGASRY
jgi:hypothetical protein